MPWGWDGTGEKSVALGGRRGTVEEAAEAKAWPKYEVEYLQHRLDNPAGKYLQAGSATQDVKDHILLERAAEDYKEEADECLKAEFKDWLAGRHKDNFEQRPYENGAGKPVRRYTYRDQLVHAPKNADGTDRFQIGDAMVSDAHEKGSKHDWKPTWWGQTQLTHLPGVRDYLKETEQKRSDADMYMNLLAEHGPQDLKSAWMYFKHWVKGRPVGPETCPTDSLHPIDIMYTPTDGPIVVPGTYVTKPPVGQRSDFHNNMPAKLRGAEPRSERIMEAGLLQTINTAVQGGVATALATTGTPATTEQPRARGFDNTPMIDLSTAIEATAITDGLNQSLAASPDFSLATPSGSTSVPLPEETATEKAYHDFSALPPEEQQELLKTNPDGDWFNADGSPRKALNPGIPRARPDSPNTAESLERELAAASLNDQRDATTPSRPVPASPLQALQVRFTRAATQAASAATQAASALNPARVQIMPNTSAPRFAAETRAATAQRLSEMQPRTMGRRAAPNRRSGSRG